MTSTPPRGAERDGLLRLGTRLELVTLGWNVIGVVVLAFLALRAASIALAGFGLDSLVEIGASTVVLWELRGVESERERRALILIAVSFAAISAYLVTQATWDLTHGSHPHPSPGGIAWTGATAVAMFVLAHHKGRVGRAASRDVLIREGRVTFIDGLLATAILIGLSLNALAGWWWADPASTYVIVVYGVRECVDLGRQLRVPTSRPPDGARP
ncbi:MAG: cation transporter [Acidobacteriota bacterium]|nr:cation transporter [Acidobacteriota bacterium]